MARAPSRHAHRALPGLVVALALAGCGGGGGSESDAEAVASVLERAADAVADRDGDRACSHLTEDGQRQAMLRFGGGAAQQPGSDCATFVNRLTLFLTPIDRERIGDLEATQVGVDGGRASGTLASPAGAEPAMSVRMNLEKVGDEWKIDGFAEVQGAPGT